MCGQNGSCDAIGTWVLLMAAAGVLSTVPGVLAALGRWRSWYRPVDTPIRYGPLVAIPFGAGCLVEAVTVLLPLPNAARQVVVVVLFACLLLSGVLFLRFPARLRPRWIREIDQKNEAGTEVPASRL